MIAARRRAPGFAAGTPYPEQPDPKWNRLDAALTAAWSGLTRRPLAPWHRASLARFAAQVEALAPSLADLPDPALRDRADALRAPLVKHGLRPALAAEAFALAREASRRVLGLRHHAVQLMGGAAMLRGALAEMDTGEGKTITALLPSVAFALAGRPVHVVTVNEYLAARDAEQLRPVLAALGISTGLVVLDELNIALKYGYLDVADVITDIESRPEMQHVIVTGRGAPDALIEAADTVTDMGVVKHAFKAGIAAQAGVEF